MSASIDDGTPVVVGGGQAGARRWRIGLLSATLVAGAVLAAALPVHSALALMFTWWLGNPEYSHGIIIPFVSAYLIWRRKEELAQLEFVGSGWGPVLVLAGVVLEAAGELATVYPLIQYAFLVVLLGLVLSWTGWPVFRRLGMPLLILFFMVPLPQFIISMLSGELQLLSSNFGVATMRLFGISVYLEGNVIDLGGYRLQVVEACAGLRYLFPLMTLGFIMAYMYRSAIWKRALLFASSVPLTIVMNGLRIGLIGIAVDRWGQGMAEGFLHDFQGWMMFMLTAAIMLGEVVVLNRIGGGRRGFREVFGFDWPAAPAAGAAAVRSPPAMLTVASVLVAAGAAALLVLPSRVERPPARAGFEQLELRLGEFHGRRGPLESQYVEQLQFDDYVLADYTRPGEIPVNLYVSYYASQRKGQSVHSPRVCLPGGGWQLRDFATVGVEIPGHGAQRVNRALITLGNERQLVYYWFKQRDRIVTNEWLVKWYLFVDALFRNRTDGALVRLITPIPTGGEEGAADRRLRELMAEIVPRLPRYVPN